MDLHWPRRKVLALVMLGPVGLGGLAGCSTESVEQLQRLGTPEPASDRAEGILTLWQGSWIAALLVGVVVWGLIIWAVVAYRKRSESIPPQTRYHVPIEMLYTFVPFVIVSVLFYFTVREQNAVLDTDEDNPPDHVISVVAQQWSWSFNYLDATESGDTVWEVGTPAELPTLYLPVDEKVGVRLSSPDVVHSFFVPAFLFKMDAMPGRDNYFEFTPTTEGVFSGKCAELCGIYHSRMLFDVHVVSVDEYAAHLAELEAAGQVGELTGGEFATTQRGLEPESNLEESES